MDQYMAAIKNYDNSKKQKNYKKKEISKSHDSDSSSSDHSKSSEDYDYETEDHYDGQNYVDNRPKCSKKCRCECEGGKRKADYFEQEPDYKEVKLPDYEENGYNTY
jgi:hypothetical protein